MVVRKTCEVIKRCAVRAQHESFSTPPPLFSYIFLCFVFLALTELTRLLTFELLAEHRGRLGADEHVHGLDFALQLSNSHLGFVQTARVGVCIGNLLRFFIHLNTRVRRQAGRGGGYEGKTAAKPERSAEALHTMQGESFALP